MIALEENPDLTKVSQPASGQSEVLKFFNNENVEFTKLDTGKDTYYFGFDIKELPNFRSRSGVRSGQFFELFSNRTHKSVFVVSPEGDWSQIIMELSEHIPASGQVAWSDLNEPVMSDGTLLGSPTDASFLTKCSLKKEDPFLKIEGPLEFSSLDVRSFFVNSIQDLKDTENLLSQKKKRKSLSHLMVGIKDRKALPDDLRRFVSELASQVLSEFLAYRMDLGILTDNAPEDLPSIITYLESLGEEVLNVFYSHQEELCRRICIGAPLAELPSEYCEFPVTDAKGFEDEKKTKSLRRAQYAMLCRQQTTELPWTFEEMGLSLMRSYNTIGLKESGLLKKNGPLREAYEAIMETMNRTEEFEDCLLVTKDGVTLKVLRSAYDKDSIVIVKI